MCLSFLTVDYGSHCTDFGLFAGAAPAAVPGPSQPHVEKTRIYLKESDVTFPLEVETRCMCLWKKTDQYHRVD